MGTADHDGKRRLRRLGRTGRSQRSSRSTQTDRTVPADTMPAGKVFLVMVGVLSLAALLNAEPKLQQVETSELGRSRDVALWFWRPVEAVSRPLGLGLPRSGVEALQGTDGLEPAPPGGDHDELAIGAGGTGRGRLGHEPFMPEPAAPTTIPGAASPETSGPVRPGGPDPARPSTATPLGLPPPALSEPPTGDPSAEPQPGAGEPSGPGEPAEAGEPAAGGGTTRVPAAPGSVFPLRRPTVEDPLRILIVGDSTMDAVGNSTLRDLGSTGVAVAELDFRISTGLSRPDFFDWPAHLREARAAMGTEVVVIMIGANDAQPFIIDDRPESYGTERWFATYRQRVAALLDELTADGGWVIWIGQPVMRSQDYDAKMQQLNQIYAEETARYASAIFIDTRTIMADESGAYAPYLVDVGGTRQLVRQGDGVHLTSAGGDRLSPVIIEALNEIAPLY